jgi:ATP-dependent DNA ligase
MRTSAVVKILASLPSRSAAFVEPMECLAVTELPDGQQWLYEIKLDGYRAQVVRSENSVTLYSRRRKLLNRQFPLIVEALSGLPENTVIDGEVVALDHLGRPDFNLLQNFRAEASHIHYFVFDLVVYRNRDLTRLPLFERREVMRSVLKFPSPRIRISDYVQASPTDMLHAVRAQGLEGIIGKRGDSVYEAGKRSGAWIKYRVNCGQELVIGGYLPGVHGMDSVIVGYYRGEDLIYVCRAPLASVG